MKFIKNIFNAQRKHFEGDGKLAFLKPLFDATETFFFIPGETTEYPPYARDAIDLKRFMSVVLVALIPPLVFGIYNAGYHTNLACGLPLDFMSVFINGLKVVLPLIIVSYGVGFFWETVFASIRKHPISEGLLVTGLLFPLTLPPTIPLWQAALGMTFGIVIGKEIFGGTGRNIFNPALVGRAFLFFAYPAKMSGNVWVAADASCGNAVDIVTGATPLACTSIIPPYENIEATLHNAGFTLKTLFVGGYPGSIGGTSALCILSGAIILIFFGIASFRIIAGGVAGVLLTGLLLNLAAGPDTLPWFSINPMYHLVTGGFLFGIVYMATDPVSAPGMEKSKWIYGMAIGVLTVLIRVVNPAYPEGVMMAILFMNLFAPLMDHVEINLRLKKRIPNV